MNSWQIKNAPVPKLLAAVAQYLPEAGTVAFEIHNACPEAQQIFTKHLSTVKFEPSRDTAYPETELHYCKISSSLVDDLEKVLRDHKIKTVFWHLKGFGARRMLFLIHDADMGAPVYFSGRIGADAIARVAAALKQEPIPIDTGCNWGKKYT